MVWGTCAGGWQAGTGGGQGTQKREQNGFITRSLLVQLLSIGSCHLPSPLMGPEEALGSGAGRAPMYQPHPAPGMVPQHPLPWLLPPFSLFLSSACSFTIFC